MTEDQLVALRRANELVREIQSLEGAERKARLEALARHEPETCRRVRRLLDRLDADQSEWPEAGDGHVPKNIGDYQIIRQIGQGGSSDVFLARQSVDGVNRTVAVKVLRGTTDQAGLTERLARERRILACLQHPGIAAIHDLGATADGHPYLVVEYVEGRPLDSWCDQDKPSLSQRLKVFLAVADPVAYAHRRLVIHRDLKPGNILIDGDGRPRLLDFGIAKVLDESEPDHELTTVNALPLSLPFASPELIAAEPAGLASDVYQLGALLYLLLTGQRPFAEQSRFNLWQAVVSGHFRPPRAVVGRQVPAELEAIVLKAMERRPEQRYPSVERLSDDVLAFVEGRPVAATNRGQLYRAGKFVRRHALAVSLAAVLGLSLIGFSVSVGLLSLRLDGARVAALEEGQLSEAALDYLVGIFRSVDPAEARGRALSLQDVLDQGTAELETRLGENPRLRFRVHVALGEVYESIERYDAAQEHFTAALQLLDDEAVIADAQSYPLVLTGVARNALRNGDSGYAERLYRRVLALSIAADTVWRTRALASLAVIAGWRGEDERALQLGEQAAQFFEAQLGPDSPDSIKARFNVAQMYLAGDGWFRVDRLETALERLVDVGQRAVVTWGKDHPLTVQIQLFELRCRARLGQFEQSMAGLHELIPLAARILGDTHLSVLKARLQLGLAMIHAGRSETGLELMTAATQRLDERYSGAHRDRAEAHLDLAEAQLALADVSAAEREIETALELGADPQEIAARPALASLNGDQIKP